MSVKLFWHTSSNFGDALSPYILSKLLNLSVQDIEFEPHNSVLQKYMITGSLLSCDNNEIKRSTINNAIIFGNGFADSRHCFVAKNIVVKGVRGNMTLKKIIDQQNENDNTGIIIDDNVIVGEPSLCLPYFYIPLSSINKFTLGIIPHIVDYDRAVSLYGGDKNILIINLSQQEGEKLNDFIERVISQINQCENTISSSLHGLIASIAYNIPTDWCQFSKGKIIGDNFKFYDFIESVNNINDENGLIQPINIVENKIDADDLLKNHRKILNKKINVNEVIFNSNFIKNLH